MAGITREQKKKIYAWGAISGMLKHDCGAEDELHLWIKSFTGAEHISDLTEKQANLVISKLIAYCNGNKDSRPEGGYMTREQQRYVFKLMYKLVELSPSVVALRDRLAGIIKTVTGKTPKNDLFFGLTMEEGANIIETLKRYISTEARKIRRKEVEAHGTGAVCEKEPP